MNIKSKTLTIIRGLPGSGKSTIAKELVDSHGSYGIIAEYYEADMYFMQHGVYNFNREILHRAHRWCQDSTRISLFHGKFVMVSNTFTTLNEIREYEKIAEETCAKMKVFKVIGNHGSVHGVPEDVLENMRTRWQDYPGESIWNNEEHYES